MVFEGGKKLGQATKKTKSLFVVWNSIWERNNGKNSLCWECTVNLYMVCGDITSLQSVGYLRRDCPPSPQVVVWTIQVRCVTLHSSPTRGHWLQQPFLTFQYNFTRIIYTQRFAILGWFLWNLTELADPLPQGRAQGNQSEIMWLENPSFPR